MSRLLNNIAKYPIEPSMMSLSEDPNYIVLNPTSKPDKTKMMDVRIELVSQETLPDEVSFLMQSASGSTYLIKGVRDKSKLTIDTFFINDDINISTANFAMCLSQNLFLAANYNVELVYKVDYSGTYPTNYVSIVNKPNFELFKMVSYDTDFFHFSSDIPQEIEYDSLLGSDSSCEILVNYYKNRSVEIDNAPTETNRWNEAVIGDLITQTSKEYAGENVWFNVNAIPSFMVKYNLLDLTNKDWFDCGTSFDFSFSILKTNGIDTMPLYISDNITVVQGYTKNAQPTDLSPYLFSKSATRKINPLTRFDTVTHIRGMIHYFNFLANTKDISAESEVSLSYTLYTNSGKKMASVEANNQSKYEVSVVNSVQFDLDSIIEDYPICAIVEVVLMIDGVVRSTPLTFNILPGCYYNSTDFVYLNSMGGWSSICLASSLNSETKITTTTINTNRTPYTSSKEGVVRTFKTENETTYTLSSLPLSEEEKDQFLEFYSSKAIYDTKSQRRIVPIGSTLKQEDNSLSVYDFKYMYANESN